MGNTSYKYTLFIEKGVVVDRKRTHPAKIKNAKFLKGYTELLITIHEGRKRQIRIMFSKVGHNQNDLLKIVNHELPR